MNTLRELRQSLNLSRINVFFYNLNLKQLDNLSLNDPDAVVEIYSKLKSYHQFPLLAALLKQPFALTCLLHQTHFELYQALVQGQEQLQQYLNGLPQSMLHTLAADEAVLSLIYLCGGINLLELLLALPNDDQKQAHAQAELVNWSASEGHTGLTNRLLNISSVSEIIGADKTAITLWWALSTQDQKLIDRLIEIPAVRQFPKQGFDTFADPTPRNFVLLSLKRALWLCLQAEPGFKQIRGIQGLRAFATNFFEQHPDWLGPAYDFVSVEQLAVSLTVQNHTLRHQRHVTGLEGLVADTIVSCFESYLQLPKTLYHFQEVKLTPSSQLAFRLSKKVTQERRNRPEELSSNFKFLHENFLVGLAKLEMGVKNPSINNKLKT